MVTCVTSLPVRARWSPRSRIHRSARRPSVDRGGRRRARPRAATLARPVRTRRAHRATAPTESSCDASAGSGSARGGGRAGARRTSPTRRRPRTGSSAAGPSARATRARRARTARRRGGARRATRSPRYVRVLGGHARVEEAPEGARDRVRVRVADRGARLVDEPRPARSTRRDHSWSSLIVRSSRNGIPLEHATGDGRVDVREERRLEVSSSSGPRAAGRAARPVEEVEEEPLGRPRVGVGELAAVAPATSSAPRAARRAARASARRRRRRPAR